MTNLLKNDWTLSTTTLCMHPLYMCIRTRLSACLSVFLWACVRAQEVGIALGHAGIFGPKGLVGERGKSAILTKRMPGKLNIMGDLPYLFCSSAARQNSWKDNKERKAGKPAKSCTAYGKVTRFPLLLFGLQLQTSVCVCVSLEHNEANLWSIRRHRVVFMSTYQERENVAKIRETDTIANGQRKKFQIMRFWRCFAMKRDNIMRMGNPIKWL